MKEAVGLEIGSTSVRAARVCFDKHPAVLEEFVSASLPAGAVREGEIVDPVAVAQTVSALLASMQSRPKKVMLTVANQKVVARPIDLPLMDEEELRGAIGFQVQELIPIPVEPAILDFQILSEFKAESGEAMMKVLVVAAQKEMIASYVDVLKRANVVPELIDFTPLALIRSLSMGDSSGPASDEAEALVEVGQGVASVVVHQAGVPKLARVLAAEESLDDASADVLVDQIRGSLDYYQTQADGAPLTRIVLTGSSSEEGDLRERVESALQLPVELGNPVSRNCVSRKEGNNDALETDRLMAGPVGVALGAAA